MIKVPGYPLIVISILAVVLITACNQDAEIFVDTTNTQSSLHYKGSIEMTGEFSPFHLVNEPHYVDVYDVDFIGDEEWVLVYKSNNGSHFIFPHSEMLVEVVNDYYDEIPVAINFCPLTGTGMAWNRNIDGDTVLLSASGMLYRDNLVLWDSLSGNLWSQMKLESFTEKYAFSDIEILPLIQMKWSIARSAFRGAMVFVSDCDIKCSGGRNELLFNSGQFHQYDAGELLYGLVAKNGTVSPFSIHDFENDFSLKNIKVNGNKVIVIGSKGSEIITAFKTNRSFSIVKDSFPIVLVDESGAYWDIFGQAVSGPEKGDRLAAADAFFARNQAWQDVYSD